ncbi:MAG: flagellar assembly peptidoglycan hydrolase FlgJ [Thiobacillaceae bacterium]
MIPAADLSSKFALDVQGVNSLKLESKQPSADAIKKTAEQFEAMFMNMMLKSMREASPQDGMFDSEQTRTFTSMLDQQLSQKMASRGVGLADVLVRQLSSTLGLNSNPGIEPTSAATQSSAQETLPASSSVLEPTVNNPARFNQGEPVKNEPARHVQDFTQRILPHAREASAQTGIPAQFMVGQAALESGWGKGEIRAADGQQSFNLFGIKAGGSWKGRSVAVTTTEYVDGKPQRTVAAFRAYDSYADAFRDYANVLRANPRYQNVIAQGQDAAGFAQGLQRAGYATDPNYAQKLMNVIRQI